jgi:hypothetical protein
MADIGTLTPEQMLQQQQILRQQKMAEMLMQQGMEQPKGQMISGHYVAPSIFQNLAGLANTYVGQRGIEKAEQAQIDLAKQLRENEISASADYLKEAKGAPAVVQNTELAGPYAGNIPMPIAQKEISPAIAPNPQGAYANLYANPKASAMQRNFAWQGMNAPPKEFDLSEGAIRFKEMPDGTTQIVAKGGEKLHSVGKNLVTSSGKVVFTAPLTGEEKVNPQESGLRSSFFTQAQPHIATSQAYRKIESAPETAAGDLSLIYGYMKILDPGSAVKEGEYATAENARGVPETIKAQYNKTLNGQRLATRQRTEFIQSAGDLVKSQQQQFNTQKDYFTNIASKYKIDPENIIYDPYADLKIQTTPPKQPKSKVNIGKQLNIPQSNIINQADAIISGNTGK